MYWILSDQIVPAKTKITFQIQVLNKSLLTYRYHTWITEIQMTEKRKVIAKIGSGSQAAIQKEWFVQLRGIVDADPHLQREDGAQYTEEAQVENS